MVNDVHCHFFSMSFLQILAREKGLTDSGDSAEQLSQSLGWDSPGSPEELADRWIRELDQHGVDRAALIASLPGDEDSVAAAVARHPRRLVGFFMVNPLLEKVEDRVKRALTRLGMRCICLFPSMHRYSLDESPARRMFELASEHKAAVFVHCGVLSVGVRKKLGLPCRFDVRRADPLHVQAVAVDFPEVPVLIPHFGAGFFREALMAADLCPNVHLDTSSSNGWMRYVPGLTLKDVFRQTLAVAGPDRILFGTDSSFFPRGWQRLVWQMQVEAFDQLGLEESVRRRILYDNFDRLFPPVAGG